MHQAINLFGHETDSLTFFNGYLGEDVIASLPDRAKPVNIKPEQRALLMDVVKLFALLMPQADHVVRRDVRSEFEMYVGYKSPGGPQRGHYIDMSLSGHGILFEIGGSPDPERRLALANEHACTKSLNGSVVADGSSLKELSSCLKQVAAIYNPVIRSQKGGVVGWTPATSRSVEGAEAMPAPDARRLVVDYCRPLRQELGQDRWRYLTSVLDAVLVPAVRQGMTPEKAVEAAFDGYVV